MLVFAAGIASAQVDSQWRGPGRDGIYPGEKLLKKWPARGPSLIWSYEDLGIGFSSPSVTKDRVYINGMKGSTGILYAFDLKGKLVWKKEYGPEWTGDYSGTRGSVAVVGDDLYLVSGRGVVYCLSADGKIQWSVDMKDRFGGRIPRWGYVESPLIDGDRIFCTPGADHVTLAALDRHTGKTIWKTDANGELSAYCSPQLVYHGKRRLIITMTQKSVVGFDAESGKYLWSHHHETDYDIHPNTPTYKDGWLYVTSGYGTGGQMLKLSPDGASVKKVWEQPHLDSQIGATVLVDGIIYGSGHNGRGRGWHGVDWKTGEMKFTERTLGSKGNIIYSDGLMYCYSERGDVGIVKPDPSKFDVISSFKIEKGTDQHWAHLVIRDGRLYVRHGNAIMSYDIGK
jgi:outer membrane protein assembly factor BamB